MKKKILHSLILVLVMALIGIYALPGCSATESSDVATDNASFHFDEEEIIRQLKEKNIDSINKDLIKEVKSEKLSGAVNVIITLSDGSVLGQYNRSGKNTSLAQYLAGAEAQTASAKAITRQNKLEDQLVKEGLITSAKYHYSNIVDGFAATTTYENLSKLVNHDGVYSVIIGNTYLEQEAVTNDVKVFETGIFKNNVSDKYTGKGTLVAILDTGCDYAHPAFTTHEVVDPRYDRSDIERILNENDLVAERLAGGNLQAHELYYGNLTKNKIAFGYDYADNDTDVMPFLSEHGTHVAGIIGGYATESIFEQNDDFDGSADTHLEGVAIDTQFAIMKVFSDYRSGAEDEDILAALEDCVALGVDAINMSLGASCGFSREYDNDEKNRIYDEIADAGISLIVAASNDYSSAYGSEFGNTNMVQNPDSGTVGSPATYNSALAVASINGNMDKYITSEDGRVIFFQEAADMGSEYYDFFEKLFENTNTQGDELVIDYITVPGLGATANYSAIAQEIKGKIALVKRGDLSFEDKAINAAIAGAAGVIIYNNVYGDILMTVGKAGETVAVCSIGKDDGEYLAKNPTGTLIINKNNKAGPFMSDFSSWGPNPDLTIKPEITAHGGNIWSAVPGGGYEKLSGTSMACPNLVGIAVLARQYVKDNYKIFDPEAVSAEDADPVLLRNAVNQLLMSTATIAQNQEGNPYSPRKQGAGIADIFKATTTRAYMYTKDSDGNIMNTTKMELGDDPTRQGVYEMTFFLRNISDSDVRYKLGNYTFTESLSADKKYVAEKAYMLSHSVEYNVVSGGTLAGDLVTVKANETAEITVKITLSDADKQYLNNSFVNGMYVEGFVTLKDRSPNGVDLNIPFLAFYGDWGEAPILDKDYYEVETTAHNNAIDDQDKIKADYVATTPYALYYYDYIIPMGTYLYNLPAGYNAIPATEEHAALSYQPTTLNQLYAVYTGLLRSAKKLSVQIRNASTGEVVWNMDDYNCYKAHFNGSPMPYVCEFELPMFDFDVLTSDMIGNINGAFGYNNERFEVTMTASLDWESDRNSNDTYTFSFYVDTEAPTVSGYTFRSKYNNSTRKWQYFIDLEIYDNHYAQSVRPVVINWSFNPDGTPEMSNGQQLVTVDALNNNAIPVYQTTRGSSTKVEIEITNYMDNIRKSLMPDCILFQIDDYALNTNLIRIPLPEMDNPDLDFDKTLLTNTGSVRYDETNGVTLDIGQTLDLTKYVVGTGNYTLDTTVNHIENFLYLLNWKSADETIATAHDGLIEGRSEGTTTVSFTSGGEEHTIKITVTDVESTDRNGYDQSTLEEVKFTGYKTLFAFTGDIDFSEIGETGDTNYFSGGAGISCYPSEQIQLIPQIKPWNFEQNKSRYELVWRTTNPDVATVTTDGIVTAEAEGNCTITMSVRDTATGRENVLQASCSVVVKSEFVTNDARQLIAYKGKGGDVVIPDDKGIMYINSFAFCHYSMDNTIELPEDDKYNLDLKRTPFVNTTVKSVTIPDTVTSIETYAFGNCLVLEEVKIGEDSKLTTIGQHAFDGCVNLRSINLNKVHMINDYAFRNCTDLVDVGTNMLARPYGLGVSAFENCTSLKELNLSNLRRGRENTFKGCVGLTTLTLGSSTRLSYGMFEGCTAISKTRNANGAEQDIYAGNPLVIYSDVVSERSFFGCTSLKGVKFANAVTYVDDGAFQNCTGLQLVTFSKGCETLGANSFAGCNNIGTFDVKDANGADGFTYDGTTKAVYNGDKTVLLYVHSNVTEFALPASVREIANGAFSGLTSLRTVTIPVGSALTRIGDDAFRGCASLTSINIPDSVTYIGSGAFAGTNVGSVDLSGTSITSIGDGAFYGDGSLTSVILPDSCTHIGNSAFENCTRLGSIDLGKVTYVGNRAFVGTAITDVAFDGDVTVGASAFAGGYHYEIDELYSTLTLVLDRASALSSVSFGGKAIIGDYAFINTGLSTLTITEPDSTIGNYAFYGCLALQTADINGVTGKLGDYAFAYCLTESANGPVGLMTVNMNNVTELGEGAFEGSTRLRTINSNSLTKVGDNAFYPNLDLGYAMTFSNINLSKVTEIGSFAFYYCSGLQSLNMPLVEKIGDRAFILCENLTSVTAPVLKEIGREAFAMCGITSFRAPALEVILPRAFVDTPITTLEIGDNLKQAEGAMAGASRFTGFTHNGTGAAYETLGSTGIVLDNGVLYIKKNNGLELVCYPAAKRNGSYEVREGTTRIGFMAATGNIYLSQVTLPSTLLSIGDYAFADCSGLKTVIFNSYNAPLLEGISNVAQEVRKTPPEDPTEDYMDPSELPYLDELYGYDFYFNFESAGEISYYYGNLYNYRHFVDLVGKVKLTMQIPVNSFGYDSPIYKAYFNVSDQLLPETLGRYASEFLNAVKALRDLPQIDRYATTQINDAITAYNRLVANKEERYVEQSDLNFYNEALSLYYIDVAYHSITHLYTMDDSLYSYKTLSAALQNYNRLSGEEKFQLDTLLSDAGFQSAKTILDAKSAEYKQASGFNGDVSKDYVDHVIDLLQELFGDLKPEDITQDDFDKLVQAYNIIHNWLTDKEIRDNDTKLEPYQAYIRFWNTAASNTGVISTAETIAHAPVDALFASIASFNALMFAAYVALKGGIL